MDESSLKFNHYLSSDKSITTFYKSDSGIMWVGTRDGLYDYLGDNIYGSAVIFPGRSIEYVAEDQENRLWVCSGEVFIYDLKSGKTYDAISTQKLLGADSLVTEFCISPKSGIWFSSGKYIYHKDNKNLEKVFNASCDVVSMTQRDEIIYALCENGEVLRFSLDIHGEVKELSSISVPRESPEWFIRIFVDSKYNIWLSQGPYGVWMISQSGETNFLSSSSLTPSQHKLPAGYPDTFTEDKDGYVWIGFDHGGICICKDGIPVKHLSMDEQDSSSIISDSVISLFTDDEGSVWVGYYKKGLSIYYPDGYRWNMNQSEDINSICEDKEGNIYIGTDGDGLTKFDSKTGSKTFFTKFNSSLGSDVITALEADSKGGIWIGTYLGGLSYYDGKSISTFSAQDGLASSNVWSIEVDQNGMVWVAMLGGGIQVYDPSKETFSSVKGLSNESVFKIISSPTGEIFAGTGYGLDIIDSNSLTVKDVIFSQESYSDMLIDIFYDKRNLLWLNENGKLQVLDTRSGKIYTPFLPQGCLIKGFFEDEKTTNVWLVCDNNLLRYEVKSDQNGGYDFVCNTLSFESLHDLHFNERSTCKAKDGFLIGSFEGYMRLSPSQYVSASQKGHLILRLSSLYINKEEIQTGSKFLPVSLSFSDKIVLPHSDNNLAFKLDVISYSQEMRNTISYQMKGLSEDWIHLEARTTNLEFPGLKPGHYILSVKEDNIDSNPIVLSIVIRHPWYFTIWAYLCYAILLLASAGLLQRRNYLKKKRELDLIEQKHQHSVDEMKMRFFTNISHDFRTTLTLIISPLEEMISKNPDLKNDLAVSTIYRNATRLQTLVGQLLDIRKMDSQGLELVKVTSDIIPVLKECADSFKLYAEGLQIDFKFSSDTESLVMNFDHDKIIKILSNLLSNAFKYTPKGGSVQIDIDSTDSDRLRISVTDTGCGIPEEEKRQIFQRFYQSSSTGSQKLYGTGIGLHIVSEYVHLLGGEIVVEDNQPKGSVFSFTIPIERAEVVSTTTASSEQSFTVLIVDDNDDFRNFLKSSLSGDYNVLDTDNGGSALEILKEEKVDLVISDVMMPVMDGFELCRKIKSDINISHIPVLLLTAKSLPEDEIEGLSYGADDYLTKPFNMSILRFRVAKFIEWKQRSQEHFQSNKEVEPEQVEKTTLDDTFIAEAIKVITENLTDPKFSVEKLAGEMNMHRTSLYKKIEYITGKSPLEFIRKVRMQHAAKLLLDPKLYISEIAYQVGFNSPKVFALHFKEEFGMSPTEYKKSHGNI